MCFVGALSALSKVYIINVYFDRLARAEKEVDEALAGERDDNSWTWVKRKLGGVRG
jgi:hypothetical protein